MVKVKYLVKIKIVRKYMKSKILRNRIRWKKCENCKVRFHSNFCHGLHLHFHSENAVGWFICPSCEKKYKQLSNFLKHRLIHRPPVERKNEDDQCLDEEGKEQTIGE